MEFAPFAPKSSAVTKATIFSSQPGDDNLGQVRTAEYNVATGVEQSNGYVTFTMGACTYRASARVDYQKYGYRNIATTANIVLHRILSLNSVPGKQMRAELITPEYDDLLAVYEHTARQSLGECYADIERAVKGLWDSYVSSKQSVPESADDTTFALQA